MEQQIIDLLKQKILKNYDLKLDDISLETPPKKDLGDFAFGCFALSKHLKKSPMDIASELQWLLNSEDIIENASSAWPYLNIKVSKSIFTDSFYKIYGDIDGFLNMKDWNLKTIVVDYIWANVWKPMHIGHMCTPNQGQVIINIYRKLGYDVIADSHIGDWWIIFGKLITSYKLWWDEEKLLENAVDYLLELYIKITAETEEDEKLQDRIRSEFKLLSEWDEQSKKLWAMFTKQSIKAMQLQLDRLNIKPDYNIWESFYEWLWLAKMEDYPDLKYSMKDIVSELIDKNIAIKNDDNSVWVEFDEQLKIPSCILQKRDGTHGYLASDLAAIKYRMENWSPEKILYFVDVRQQLHLRQAFAIAKNAGWIWDTELFHAYNWFISLKDGAMSTRTWRIIKLDKLLDEAEQRAKKIILEKRDDMSTTELYEISKIIWIGAIKYGYLKKSRETDVIFDWDEFMSFEWNSWPYIQYAYVRARRILEKYSQNYNPEASSCHSEFISESIKRLFSSRDPETSSGWQDTVFTLSEETNLIKIISDYKVILEETANKAMPHILCSYVYNLTKAFNSFYNNVHILNEEDEEIKISRLRLTHLFSIVLKDSFSVLGIDMPEKM